MLGLLLQFCSFSLNVPFATALSPSSVCVTSPGGRWLLQARTVGTVKAGDTDLVTCHIPTGVREVVKTPRASAAGSNVA